MFCYFFLDIFLSWYLNQNNVLMISALGHQYWLLKTFIYSLCISHVKKKCHLYIICLAILLIRLDCILINMYGLEHQSCVLMNKKQVEESVKEKCGTMPFKKCISDIKYKKTYIFNFNYSMFWSMDSFLLVTFHF